MSSAKASKVRAASRILQNLSNEERQDIVRKIADALLEHADEIIAKNELDVKALSVRAESDPSVGHLQKRLKIDKDKLQVLAQGLRSIADEEDPIGRMVRKTELADGLVLTQETVPIGVLMIIFESRPDCLPQIATLAIRSGNGLILKGGKEAIHSNSILHEVITKAITEATKGKVPAEVVTLVSSRDDVKELLSQDAYIDLIIPRGSGQLVKYIKENTKIPVMGHAEGICHVYLDSNAHADKAIKIAVDSKSDYPAACNAMETLLIHKDLVTEQKDCVGSTVLAALKEAGVKCFGGPAAAKAFGLDAVESFKTEYGDLRCSVQIVDGLQDAINHIHEFGSGHTESIVTEDKATATAFQRMVDAACVFHNASTRFADGYRFGLGAEVGISTGRIHARGPVGVEGLTTTKWKLISSDCDTASEYSKGSKTFSHKRMKLL